MTINITNIRKEIYEEWKNTKYFDISEMVKTYVEHVFLRSGRFLMEFIQNAEDACMELCRQEKLRERGGRIYIKLYRDKLVFIHNGKPFDENDIKAISAIKSRKNPAEGYLGYLGIGFKSVFRVADRVVIYSRNFDGNCVSFEFNKNPERRIEHWDREIWMCLPIEYPPEALEEVLPQDFTTLFIVYFRHDKKEEIFESLKESLDKIDNHLLIFLRYIGIIEKHIQDENRHELIKVSPPNDVTPSNLRARGVEVHEVTVQERINNENPKVFEYVIFRKKFNVPLNIRKQSENIKRDKVEAREVIVAFRITYVNGRKELEPLEPHEIISGVYSFLPLSEAKSGLKFLIQADFVAQAGRENIQVEHPWNHWMMQCVAEVISIAIDYFETQVSKGEYKNYSVAFEFPSEHEYLSDVYKDLVKPYIVNNKEINEKLKNRTILAIDGKPIKLNKAVIRSESIRSLIEKELIHENDLMLLYNETDLKFVPQSVEQQIREEDRKFIKKLEILDLLNEKFIKAKLEEDFDKAIELLAEIYRIACNREIYIPDDKRYVILRSGSISLAKDAYLSEIPENIKNLAKKYPEVDNYLRNLNFIHSEFAKKLDDKIIEMLGINKVSFEEICENVLLRKIVADGEEKPNLKTLVAITALIERSGVKPKEPIWVVTRSGKIEKSSEVHFPSEYLEPIEFFEKKLKLVFVDLDKYLKLDDNKESWRKFFEKTLMKCTKKYILYYDTFWVHEDYSEIIKKIMQFINNSTKKKQIIDATRILMKLYKALSGYKGLPKLEISNIVTDEGIVKNLENCLLHDEYNPPEKWTRWKKQGFAIGPLVSPEYLTTDSSVDAWREFFLEKIGVKEKAEKEHIEKFAIWYVKEKLRERKIKILKEGGTGFDLQVKIKDEIIFIEIKGRRELNDIELTEAETKKANKEGEKYWLVVVTDIPNNPRIYLLKNPIDYTSGITIKKKIIEEKGKIID